MKFNSAYNNFTSGEWSPKMVARADVEQYPRACTKQRNAITQMQGGSFKRPGLEYVDLSFDTDATTTLNTSDKLRVFDWVLSNGKRLLIVLSEGAPTGGAKDWFVYDTDLAAMIPIIASTPANVADAAIDQAQFVQVGDKIFFVSPNVPPRQFEYLGASVFLSTHLEGPIAPWQRWLSVPYETLNSGGIAGNITVSGTFTAGGAVTLVATDPLFDATMVAGGATTYFAFVASGAIGFVVLTTVTDALNAAGLVASLLPGSSPQTYGTASGTAWAQSMWNGFKGWPRTITSFQGRLYFGGNIGYPDTLWGSRIGNVYEMFENLLTTGATDDNSRPFTLTPNTKEANNIQALSAGKMLAINSERGEIVGYGSNGALGPNDFNFESSTSFGAERVQPVRVNNFLTFVQRGGRKLRDLIFSFDEAQYKSGDLAFVADHMTINGALKELVAVEVGSSVLFARTSDGRLLSITLDRDYQVNAWSEHPIGGNYNGGAPQVIAMAALPEVNGGLDTLYMLVRRTINGNTVVYLEKMSPFFEQDAIEPITGDIPKYLDCGLREIVGSPQTVHTGFDHLEGETVSVLADGNYVGEKTVDNSGQITLDVAARDVWAGYKYQMILRPVPIEQGAQTGSPTGMHKRTNDIFIRFYKTVGCFYGVPAGEEALADMNEIEFRPWQAGALNEPIPLYTGDKRLKMPQGYRRTYEVEITSDSPYPCNVLAIVLQGGTYD